MATAETITYRVEIGGAAEAATAFDKLSASASKTSEALVKTDKSASKVTDQLERTAVSSGKFYGNMGKALQMAGRFAIALDGMDGLLGQTGNSFVAAAGNIGAWGAAFGPAGAAAGALIETLKLLRGGLEEARAEFDASSDAAVKRAAERAQMRKLAAGTVTEETGSIAFASDADFNSKLKSGGFGQYAKSGGGSARRPVNDDSAFAAVEREDAYRKQLAHLDELDAQYATQKRERELAAASDRDQMRLDEIDRQQEAYWADYDAEREVMDARAEMQEEYARKYAEREKLKKVVAIDAAQSATTAGISALQKLATGQKVTTREVIASIGEQMVARGTGHILEGTAMAIMGNPQGGALIGVGSAEVAAGLGLGAASKGGGGGGGSGSSAGGGQTRAASPTSGTTFSSTRDERPIIINYNAPTVVSPTEDDARRVKQVQDEGRRFGV